VCVCPILKPVICNYLFNMTGLQQLQLPIWTTFDVNAKEGTNIPFNCKNEVILHTCNEIVECAGFLRKQETVININNQNAIRGKKEAWIPDTLPETR